MKRLLLLWPFPPIETPLQQAPRLLLRHLSEWSYGVLNAQCSSHCKVSSFPSTKGVLPWLNFSVSHVHCKTLLSVELIFVPAEDLETRFELVKWPGQLMITGQLTFGCLKISQHFWDTCFNFSSEGAKVISLYLLLSPITKLYLFSGCKNDFFRLRLKPTVPIEKSMRLLSWEFLVTSSPLATYRLGK